MKPTNKTNTGLWGLISGLLVLAAGISSASGAIVTVPVGLNPGDTYRLVFVTAGLTTATSTDIATYNTFATNNANQAPDLLALGTTWTIIGSTSAVSAILNTGTATIGVPIYGRV